MNNNYLVLSRKWRPQQFDDVVGQFHVTKTLQNALKQNRIGHGYLFTGSRGVGKTSVARILSRVVNCPEVKNYNPCNKCNQCIQTLKGSNLDVIELDGASNRGIDEIRDLRESIKYPPTIGKYKVFIIDEVHMLTKEAFNALLKTLEEPPPYVLFVLATTDPHKIPQTILSRTQRFDFKRISINEINNYLSMILDNEKISFDKPSLSLISKKADGSMRDALSLLDQVIAYSDNKIDIKTVSEAIGIIDNSSYLEILTFILESDLSKLLAEINNVISSGHSITDFIIGFTDFLNRCLHYSIDENINDEIFLDDEIKNFLKASKLSLDINLIIKILELTIRFQNQLKFITQPMIALESHFIKLAHINNNSPSTISKNTEKETSPQKIQKKNKLIEEDISETINSDSPVEEPAISKEDKNHKESHDIDIEYIQSKWNQIINNIEKKYTKIASFMDNVEISKFSNNKLVLSVINGSQFHINSLESDVNIINEMFSDVLEKKINVHFEIKEVESKKNNKDEPKQHPLLSKAIDLLDGEILK